MNYLNKINLGQTLNDLFPIWLHNATKFTNAQMMMSIILGCFSGVNRLNRIAHFTCDALVMALLGLDKKLNKDVISTRLKELGQNGAFLLHEFQLSLTRNWLKFSQLTKITIDADSTVATVYGNQEGAAKGYNNQKKDAKSYHPLLAFVSELKLVANTWFRTGSAYTSNGICEFVNQIAANLPSNIKCVKIHFRNLGIIKQPTFFRDSRNNHQWLAYIFAIHEKTHTIKACFYFRRKDAHKIRRTDSHDCLEI